MGRGNRGKHHHGHHGHHSARGGAPTHAPDVFSSSSGNVGGVGGVIGGGGAGNINIGGPHHYHHPNGQQHFQRSAPHRAPSPVSMRSGSPVMMQHMISPRNGFQNVSMASTATAPHAAPAAQVLHSQRRGSASSHDGAGVRAFQPYSSTGGFASREASPARMRVLSGSAVIDHPQPQPFPQPPHSHAGIPSYVGAAERQDEEGPKSTTTTTTNNNINSSNNINSNSNNNQQQQQQQQRAGGHGPMNSSGLVFPGQGGVAVVGSPMRRATPPPGTAVMGSPAGIGSPVRPIGIRPAGVVGSPMAVGGPRNPAGIGSPASSALGPLGMLQAPRVPVEAPAKPPALDIRPSVGKVPVKESFVHAAIREKYGLKVSAEQLLSPETKPNLVNIQQVLLNLSSVRDVCKSEWLRDHIEAMRSDIGKVIETLSSSQCDDQAYARALDLYVAELLRAVQFPDAGQTVAPLQKSVAALKARLAEVRRQRETAKFNNIAGVEGDSNNNNNNNNNNAGSGSTASRTASGSAAAPTKVSQKSSAVSDVDTSTLEAAAVGTTVHDRILADSLDTEATLASAIENHLNQWVEALEKRRAQIESAMQEVEGRVKPQVSETLQFIKKASTSLKASCAGDKEVLELAVGDEAEDFGKEQSRLTERAEKSRATLATCRDEQSKVRSEIERLKERLAVLENEEQDTINVMTATDMKLALNRKEHDAWVQNCNLWRSYLETTAANTDRRLNIVTTLDGTTERTYGALSRHFAELGAGISDLRREALSARLDAFSAAIVATGQLLNAKIQQRDRVKEELTEATVQAEAHRFAASDRLRRWEEEVVSLRSEERSLADAITKLTQRFLQRRREFEAFEVSLKAAGISYEHPAVKLEEMLEKDRVAEEERKQKVQKFKRNVRKSLDNGQAEEAFRAVTGTKAN